MRKIADHLDMDVSQVSRTFNGLRRMQADEAQKIALFLHVPVSDVMTHAGLGVAVDGVVSRIKLAAIIDDTGALKRLTDSRPLPQSIIDQAEQSIGPDPRRRVIAAQIRAAGGPLAVWDDAVVLFEAATGVAPAAIGSLSICRGRDGQQMMCKVERARKTGEAHVISVSGMGSEIILETASPVIAVIP
jgi:hypothetical protein